MITSLQQIRQLGTIMAVWAHPDDETYCAAGILAAAVQNGQKVICVTATRGEAGVQDDKKWPAETLGETRAKELGAALRVLGITNHEWLDCRDGGCSEANSSVVQAKICQLIDRHKPQTILTFGKEGLTGHTDHSTVSTWVTEACKSLETAPSVYYVVHTTAQRESLKVLDAKLDVFFNIDEPPFKSPSECDICFELTPELRKLKLKALKSMPSQTQKMLELFSEDFLCTSLGIEAFVKADSK